MTVSISKEYKQILKLEQLKQDTEELLDAQRAHTEDSMNKAFEQKQLIHFLLSFLLKLKTEVEKKQTILIVVTFTDSKNDSMNRAHSETEKPSFLNWGTFVQVEVVLN